MMCRIIILLASALFLTACVAPQQGVRRYLEHYDIIDPHPSNFRICYSHGCDKSAQVQLSAEQWERVRAVFAQRPSNAAEEREYLARAIGVLESIVGPLTGTDVDIGGSFQGMFRNYQMDCDDESVNTLMYLTMMENDGLITYHDIYRPTSRGFVIMGWPHTTTVLRDKQTRKKFAIDSWFGDNGQPAYVVPLKKWKWGWRPKDDEKE
jgi:hypothetical protein